MVRALIVEPNGVEASFWAKALLDYGIESSQCPTGREALTELFTGRYDAIVVDAANDDGEVRDLICAAQRAEKSAAVIVVGPQGSDLDRVVEHMRRGANDYLARPITASDLVSAVQRAATEVASHQQPEPPGEALVGESPAMCDLRALVDQVADSSATVLIYGESGTGKELVARALHAEGPRRHGPFVALNCAAIPESLLESELFGHVKGAFTGASQARVGRFELAQGGTLFLDEIGDMPIALQTKLLRVLQEKVVEPIGGARSVRVDVRIIAATNRDLETLVQAGRFRDDLYYRLNVIPINVPALRERREDIADLCRHFVARANRARGGQLAGFTDEALEALGAYSWPGNVRELENLVERMVVLKRRGTVTLGDIPERFSGAPPRVGEGSPAATNELPQGGVDLRGLLAGLETRLIQQALTRSRGNKNQAATLLGLNRTTLVEKLKRMRMGVAA
jgi:DNA-binding NtrC family response regulator